MLLKIKILFYELQAQNYNKISFKNEHVNNVGFFLAGEEGEIYSPS